MNQSALPKIAIIIPAHNEERRIRKTLTSYSNYFEELKKKNILSYKIIVVINASKDNTLNIVKAESKNNKSIIYLVLIKGGKGYAVIEGFKFALQKEFTLLGFVDADMSTPPEAFYDLVKNIKDKEGIIASRWAKGSTVKISQTFLRRIMSRTFNFLVRSILGLHFTDTQCGAKLFKSDALKKTIPHLGMTQWVFDIEILYKMNLLGFKIAETSTIWEDKKGSKIDLVRSPFQMFTGILRLRLLQSPFRFIVKAYDSLPESLKIHHRL